MDDMDDVRRGTWIINVSKHLNEVRPSAPELEYYEASLQAGQAGHLLARMAGDNSEIISGEKLKAFARQASVRRGELKHCLDLLKSENKVDYTVDEKGQPTAVEVYSFSTRDALQTTSSVFEKLDATSHERASIVALERTLYLPHNHDQMLGVMSEAGCDDEDAELALNLSRTLSLVKENGDGSDRLYFNEYAFNDDPERIARALRGLSPEKLNDIKAVQKLLQGSPGYPMDQLSQNVNPKVLEMMEGVGLLDAMPVRSPHGQAVFATIPQLRGATLGNPVLSADVFHKAKALLNCLRYGQYFSSYGRGRIEDDNMLVNIVKKLVRGEELRPSTAAGEDYRILEIEGVISTRPYGDGMHIMRLRQREVGEVVLQMLEYHSAMPDFDARSADGSFPTSYDVPEKRRNEILSRQTAGLKPAIESLLHAVRTGDR